jgi:hypothetical protein
MRALYRGSVVDAQRAARVGVGAIDKNVNPD